MPIDITCNPEFDKKAQVVTRLVQRGRVTPALYIDIYTYVCIYIYIYIHTCICVYTYICIYIYKYTCIYIIFLIVVTYDPEFDPHKDAQGVTRLVERGRLTPALYIFSYIYTCV